MARILALALTTSALAWCAVLLLAPVLVSRGGPQLASASALIYQGAGQICHQRPERSFTIAGVQQPVCARCFGLYAAGALGALLGWAAVARRRDRSYDRDLLILCAAPTAITFGLEFVGLAYPSSTVRAIAALPLGIASGWVFIRALREEASQVPAPSSQLRR